MPVRRVTARKGAPNHTGTLLDGSTRRFARLKARRKLWLQVHLYLGLFAGAMLVVIGLTGSILAFFWDIDEWLNPEFFAVALPKAGAAYRPLDEIVAAGIAAVPESGRSLALWFPRDAQSAFTVDYQLPIPDPA